MSLRHSRISPTRTPLARRAGMLLISALIIIMLAAGMTVVMTRSLTDQVRLHGRRRDLSRSFYVAESGVAQVVHWGNHSSDYTKDASLFVRATTTSSSGGSSSGGSTAIANVDVDPAAMFPSLAAALAAGGVTIDQSDLEDMGVGHFVSTQNAEIGQIEKIELLPPESDDPVACFFKVRSRGRSVQGVERTVLAYIDIPPVLAIRIPAALLSYNVASVFGNARIHWGEAWSKNGFDMLAKSQMSYVVPGSSGYDSRAIYRTEGAINFPSTWKWGSGKDLYDATRTQPGLAPASGNYANAFYQHLPAGTLKWPEFDYQTFKDMALAHGRYYGTDASGNIYKDGIKDSAHQVSFLTEFGVADRDSSPYDLIFIDTVNAQAPAANGSNLATIRASGNSLGLKGIIWIGANFDGSGVGSPPAVSNAQDPDGVTQSLSKIFMDGVLYAAGTMELGGNAGIYGAAITQRGFSGGGTPDVYYNRQLADGLVLDNGNTGSIFRVRLQKNY